MDPLADEHGLFLYQVR